MYKHPHTGKILLSPVSLALAHTRSRRGVQACTSYSAGPHGVQSVHTESCAPSQPPERYCPVTSVRPSKSRISCLHCVHRSQCVPSNRVHRSSPQGCPPSPATHRRPAHQNPGNSVHMEHVNASRDANATRAADGSTAFCATTEGVGAGCPQILGRMHISWESGSLVPFTIDHGASPSSYSPSLVSVAEERASAQDASEHKKDDQCRW